MDEEIESPLAWSLGTSLRRVADDETFVSDSQILGKGEPWGEDDDKSLGLRLVVNHFCLRSSSLASGSLTFSQGLWTTKNPDRC